METKPDTKVENSNEYVVFNYCPIEVMEPTMIKQIKDMLPYWRTEVLDIQILKNSNMLIRCCIAATTVEEIKEWIRAYEIRTNAIYSIKSTERSSGKYVHFKQRLYCRHNTSCPRTYEPNTKTRTRNTNCGANINITLRVVNKVYRGKDPRKAPRPDMPCEMVLQPVHNHETLYSNSIRFQVISDETKEHLIKLFEEGHTPATAMKILKMSLPLNNETCEQLYKNRRCYDYCRYLYKKEFVKQPKETCQESVESRIIAYNEEMREESIRIEFDDMDYVLCICPPLFRRANKYVKNASEVVFLDSTGPVNNDGSTNYMLLTHSTCGASIPLGLIIASNENLLSTGLNIFKSMLGEDLFGGNLDGPTAFIIDESVTNQNAIETTFRNSTIYLCTFHVLQTVWTWLMTIENDIKREDQIELYIEFKSIMFANSETECEKMYKEALQSALKYPNYMKYLEDYFKRKKLWVLTYREHLFLRDQNSNLNCDFAALLLKDKIFSKTKAYNLVQRIDFIVTKLIPFYERRLSDTSRGKTKKSGYQYSVKKPPVDLKEKVHRKVDLIYLVPSESVDFLLYVVNLEVLLCTCSDGRTGKICKHIHWAYSFEHCESFIYKVDDDYEKKMLYYVATGTELIQNWSHPIMFKCLDEHEDFANTENNEDFCPTENEELDIAENVELCIVEDEEFDESLIPVEATYSVRSPNETSIEISTEELVREENKSIIEDIGKTLLTLSESAPLEVGAALNTMKENLERVKSISALTTLCTSLNTDFKRSDSPVLTTPIATKRVIDSTETNSQHNVVSPPKKRIIILKKP